ncbi:MAG: hypothetical protein K0R66_451 [Gammaproteobacteria bacterium]|jgi:hypothetical protein|nr:hypothetical protein [Gammaproteobacteria bacterium]
MPFATKLAIASNETGSLYALQSQLRLYNYSGSEIAPQIQAFDIMQNFNLDEQTDGIILWLNLNKTDIDQYLDNFLFEINHHLNESTQAKIFVLPFTNGQNLSMQPAALQGMIEEKLGLDSPSKISKLPWKFHEAILNFNDSAEIRRIAEIVLRSSLGMASPEARPQLELPSDNGSVMTLATSWLSNLRSTRSSAHSKTKEATK